MSEERLQQGVTAQPRAGSRSSSIPGCPRCHQLGHPAGRASPGWAWSPASRPASPGLHPGPKPCPLFPTASPCLSPQCPRSVPAHRTGCWELRPQHSPLADDLGVRFHQVVGDVPARQVQQDVTRAPLHLPGTHRRMDTRPLRPPPEHRQHPRVTCGGGSPPAAGGHSGSILRAPGPLHWHGGDGSAHVQFPRCSTSSMAGGAGGCQKPSGWDAGGHGPVLLTGHRGDGEPHQEPGTSEGP